MTRYIKTSKHRTGHYLITINDSGSMYQFELIDGIQGRTPWVLYTIKGVEVYRFSLKSHALACLNRCTSADLISMSESESCAYA